MLKLSNASETIIHSECWCCINNKKCLEIFMKFVLYISYIDFVANRDTPFLLQRWSNTSTATQYQKIRIDHLASICVFIIFPDDTYVMIPYLLYAG